MARRHLITEKRTSRELQTNYFRSVKISPRPLVCHRKDLQLKAVKFLRWLGSPVLAISIDAGYLSQAVLRICCGVMHCLCAFENAKPTGIEPKSGRKSRDTSVNFFACVDETNKKRRSHGCRKQRQSTYLNAFSDDRQP